VTINRVRVLWQNFPGAPGYTNHYVGSLVTAQTAIRTFYLAINNIVPTGLTLQVPSSGDQISEATGQITGTWSGAAQAVVTGLGSGNYSGASGAIVNWKTSALVAGRRVQGRSFIVPIVATSLDTQGSLSSATITTIQNAANQLITDLAGELKIWSRPRDTIAGTAATVISAQVPDLAAVLRTRRT